MPKPIRRSDRQNRDFLRRFFASKRGQEVLRGQQVEADTPFPGVQLLPEAEVYGEPTQYEEADLGKAALLALREGAGMVPIVGEALDVAEFEKIRRTGKDFYEDESDPTMYAGLTAAGMLLPNIIERPARALARGAKKFFKFGKKSEGEFDAFTEGLTWNRRTPQEPVITKKPDITKKPEDLFEPSPSEPYTQRPDILKKAEEASAGSDFVRRFFADPEVQDHYRNVLGLPKPNQSQMDDALQLMYDDAAKIKSRQSLLGSAERNRIEDIVAKDFDGDYARAFKESPEVSDLQKQFLQKLNQVGNKALDKVYRAALHPSFDAERFDKILSDSDDVVALEALFLRGQRSPDASFTYDNKYVSNAGEYDPATETVLLDSRIQDNKSVAAHETQHFADANFLRAIYDESNPNYSNAKKILKGLSESVSPKFRDQVIKNNSAPNSPYLSRPAEITARTRETQRYIANVLLNNPTKNPEIAALSQKERVAFLLGDFSVLNESSTEDVFNSAFANIARDKRGGVLQMFNEVIDGGHIGWAKDLTAPGAKVNLSKKKKESISNLFKFSLATMGAAGAYGAMDNQDKAPTGMAQGGVIYMKKKPTGMSVIRK